MIITEKKLDVAVSCSVGLSLGIASISKLSSLDKVLVLVGPDFTRKNKTKTTKMSNSKSITFWAMLTDIRPLGYTADVHFLAELRLVVVDVVEFDDKLSLRLQSSACLFAYHCGSEDVRSLLLTVQAASGVQIAIILVDDKDSASAFARQDVPYLAFVLVRLELQMETF